MQEKIKEILDQIETVIVGKNAVMERILMAILAGGCCQNPEGFRKAWKRVLFNQFHDILPGSWTRESREFALGAAQEAGSSSASSS